MIEKAPKFHITTEMLEAATSFFLLSKIGAYQKVEKKYLYWDKVKYLGENNIDSKLIWSITKLRRKIISEFGTINGKNDVITYWFNANEYLQQKLHYLDFNFGAGIHKEKLLSDLDKEQYLNNALMEESIFSSMVEGAITTRAKAKEMLRKQQKPKNKSEQMILNNYEAIQYISKHQDEDISIGKFFELHRLLTDKTLEEGNIGVFRLTNDVHVVNEITGEIVHTPPNFGELEELMLSFCDFFNSNPKENFIHPIVKASILHFLVGYIHPFVDGNGRTARAIFYWYLLKNGYWLAEYLSISRVIMKTKVQYEKAYIYTEIDEMDVTYFVHYQVKVLTKSFEDLKKYIAKKRSEQKDILRFCKIEDVNDRQAKILLWLEKEPNRFFSVKEIETIFSVNNQTARTDLEGLVTKKLLKKVAINNKTSNYWKGDAFDDIS